MNGRRTGDTETVVVGAGVIGLAIARELSRQGCPVTVLERGRPGCGASGASGGMLGPIAEAPIEEPELIEIGLESLALYPEFAAAVERESGIEVGFRTRGTLLVAVLRDHEHEMEHVAETFRQRNLRAERLTAREVRRREPGLSPRVLSGLAIPDDLRVDPRALVEALARAALAAGSRLRTGVAAEGIETEAGRVSGVRVEIEGRDHEVIPCDRVVVAAGSWSWRSMELPGPDPGLRPVKGELVRLRGGDPLQHVVRTPDVYLIPQQDRELLVGATMAERGFDDTPTAGAVLELLRQAWLVLPSVDDLAFEEVSVGHRPAVDDHLPLLGPAGPEGLWLATGHYRKGILLAPATARYLGAWMTTGRRPAELEPFDVRRLLPAREGIPG